MRHSVSASSSGAASRSRTSSPLTRRLISSMPMRRMMASTVSSVEMGSAGSMQKR
jgi:hypothetical protein